MPQSWTRMHGTLWLAFLAVCTQIAGGCGGSDSPSPRPSPDPTPTSLTVRGTIREEAPFTGNMIAGARVEFVDGPNAGKAATTDALGVYAIGQVTPGGYTWKVTAEGFDAVSVGITLTGDATQQNFTLSRSVSSPRTSFGARPYRVYRVNSEIVPGRYFSDPRTGCSWERLRGLSGSDADRITGDAQAIDHGQNIVDIKPSDVAFKTNDECGTWSKDAPVRGRVDVIPAGGGTWLVGAQVKPGRYAPSGDCLGMRLKGFSWELSDRGVFVDAIQVVSTSDGTASPVEIKSTDVGFFDGGTCGTWTRK